MELKGHTRAPDSEVTVKAMGVDKHAQGSLRIIITAKKPTSLDATEKGHMAPARQPVNANFFY